MRVSYRLLLLTVCLTAASADTRGLDPGKRLTQLAGDRWAEQEGLPSLGVFAVAQTPDGYLWLGLDTGLARFDGARFTAFDWNNAPALPRAPVFALAVAGAGRLWIGAGDGSVLVRDGRHIERLVAGDAEVEDGVMAMLEDRAGHLWVWRDLSGIARYRITAGGLEDAGLPPALAEVELPPQQIPRRSIVEDRAGRIWLASQGGGLYRLEGDRLVRFTTADGLSEDFVHTVAEDREGGVWIGTHGGLDRYRGGEIVAMSSAVGLSGGGFVALHVDQAGSLWIGQRGLFRWIARTGGLELFPGTGEIRGDLCLAEDREGGLWVGALGAGLLGLRDDGVTPLGPPEGFPDSVVLALTEDRAGRLWIGTSRAGAIVLEDGEISRVTTADGLPHNLVWSIAAGRDGEIWLGTNAGLARWTDGGPQVFTAGDGLAGDRVRVVHLDPDEPGTLWLGAIDGGLSRLRDGVVSTFETAGGLAHDNIRWLQRDGAGGLWIGLHNGLQRLQVEPALEDLRDAKLETFTKADGLASTRMRAVHLDAGGFLWLGTAGGGLSRLRGGRFVSYTRAEGMLSDDVWGILDDGDGNLWLSGDGVTRISRQDFDDYDAGRIQRLRPEAFDAPGIDRIECCVAGGIPGLWRAQDGRLWFPGAKGVASLDPRLEDRYLLPPVVVESIVADGAALAAGEPVPPGVGDLRVAYASLRPPAAGRTSFRYRLAGLDRQWTEAGARRVAYYSHLPPGRYQLQVAASAEPGRWRHPAASIPIRVLPFWWQTLWFRVAVLLAVAGLGAAGYRVRSRRIAAHNRRLQNEVDERKRAEAALRAEVQERERAEAALLEHRVQLAHVGRVTTMGELAAALAHELNQPLAAIGANARAAQRFLTAAEPDLGEIREILDDVADDNQRAAEVIRRLRALMKKQALKLERLEVGAAVEEAMALLKSEAVIKGVTLEARLAPSLPAVLADRVHLWQVLVNLIRNAIEAMADTPASERRVLVRTRGSDDGGVCVAVRDAGPGFEEDQAGALFAPFHSTKSEGLGMGLAIAQSIVEAHKGRISARRNAERGATFEVILPAAPGA